MNIKLTHLFVETYFIETRIQLRSAIPVIMQPHATCHQKIRHEGFYSLTFYEADG
jgi:hypothetical protein